MCIVHVSLVPIIGVVGEQKTKPTQHSVAVLRSLGLHPHLLACRCSEPLDEGVRQKLVGGWCVCVCGGVHHTHTHHHRLTTNNQPRTTPHNTQNKQQHKRNKKQALFCQVSDEHVLTMHDVSNIWRVPLLMQSQGAHATILRVLGLEGAAKRIDTSGWKVLSCLVFVCVLLLCVGKCCRLLPLLFLSPHHLPTHPTTNTPPPPKNKNNSATSPTAGTRSARPCASP